MNVRVYVTPKEGILDPQGVTVERALPALGFQGVAAVRIGKFIEFRLEGGNLTRQQTHEQIDDMCRKLLANPIIEDYRFEIDE